MKRMYVDPDRVVVELRDWTMVVAGGAFFTGHTGTGSALFVLSVVLPKVYYAVWSEKEIAGEILER